MIKNRYMKIYWFFYWLFIKNMYLCSPLGNMKIFIFPGPHGQTPQNPKISFKKIWLIEKFFLTLWNKWRRWGCKDSIILSLPEVIFKIKNKTGDYKWGEWVVVKIPASSLNLIVLWIKILSIQDVDDETFGLILR